MNIQEIISEIETEVIPYFGQGKTVGYIPALRDVNPNQFALTVTSTDGQQFQVGNCTEKYSIQSVSKVLTFTVALKLLGADFWKRVGREPSGDPFNSLVQLEYEHGIPRNPFINAGALVATDILISELKDAKAEILNFARDLAQNEYIDYDYSVIKSEKQMGYRNAAVINFMKSFGNIKNDIDEVLDVYFHHCSITMNTADLSKSFLYLANGGINPLNGERVTSARHAKRINSVMLTCGFYDESGEFAFRVGLPGKSGVSGAIVAVVPGKYSISVWSPELNEKGNSVLGIEALDRFTTKTDISIF